MAFLFDVERVLYQCSCDSKFPLCRLYFCRYCLVLRCADCTQPEADVYYCPQCLQSHMAPEAKLYHMKCKNCFECPSCQCVLALRAVTSASGDSSGSASPASDKAPASAVKKYYLACGYCHWTTKDVGYEDKELSDLHNSFFDTDQESIKQLREAYNLLNMRDASERAARQSTAQGIRRKTLAALAIRDDSTSKISAGITSLSRSKQLANVSTSDVLKNVMSIASNTVEPLSDDFYTRPVDLTQVSTLEQRHRDRKQQPCSVIDFRPTRKHLAIKKSFRCKECDHSVCKPEFSTSNIKFKIQQSAALQVFEVRIYPGYQLTAGKECPVVLSVSNPDHLITSAFRMSPDNDNPRSTCEIATPDTVDFQLEPKNEAFSLDDSIETDPDKEKWLAYNHGSKIGLKCTVNVPADIEGNATVCVLLHQTPLLVANSDGQNAPHEFPVTIDLGTVTN